MNNAELDTAYTALAQAIGQVGEERAQLMLATLSLSLIAKLDDANALQTALDLIAQAQNLTLEISN